MRPPHGFVILTHAHPAQLGRLAWRLHRSFGAPPVVVHHDFGQTPFAPAGLPPGLTFVRDWVPTCWATWSIVAGFLAALRDLAARPDAPEWTTVLSGADYPLRPGPAVLADLEAGGADAYLRHVRVDPALPPAPDPAPPLGHDVGEGPRNYHECVRRYFRREVRAPLFGGRSVRLGQTTRTRLARRLAPYGPGRWCHAGSAWFTLRRPAVARLLAAPAEHAWLARHLAAREAPDETYVHTVLANAPGLRLTPTNFRYVDWRGCGPNPRTLDTADLPAMLASGAHFARKFAPDAPVLDALDAHLDAYLDAQLAAPPPAPPDASGAASGAEAAPEASPAPAGR